MRKKIIFIDIDGVLNSKASRKNSEIDYYHDFISDENMRFLEYIVRATGGAEIVLSSSWKFYWNRGKTQHDEAGYYMNRIFKGYGLEISDKTSDLDNDRDAEISQWIENNKNKIESYVILDDYDYNWSSCNKKHFVMTNDETGLDESSADRAIAILNGEMLEEMKDVNEEWSRVRDIIRNTVDDKNFNLYFKDLIPIGFIVDSKRLFITCRLFTKVLIEENMRFLEILDKAIFEVFGEIEYYIEDEDVEESGFTIVSEDTDAIESVSGIKIIYDPWATYNRFPHIKAVKMRKKLSSLLKEHPERIFKSESINSELFFRVLSIFLNVFELDGLRDLKISRKGNILENYSIDTELRVDKFDTVKKIFLNCDYKKHLIRGYNIKKKYSHCPFYQHALVEEVEKFFINVDDYLTLYALINLSDVQIENVKDGRSTKIEFKRDLVLPKILKMALRIKTMAAI